MPLIFHVKLIKLIGYSFIGLNIYIIYIYLLYFLYIYNIYWAIFVFKHKNLYKICIQIKFNNFTDPDKLGQTSQT